MSRWRAVRRQRPLLDEAGEKEAVRKLLERYDVDSVALCEVPDGPIPRIGTVDWADFHSLILDLIEGVQAQLYLPE